MSLFSWLQQRMKGRPHMRCTPGRKPAPRFRPQIETLEGRVVPSTLTVTNNFDSGAGSLRAEIAAAQSKDTIVFALGQAPQVITLTSGELDITQDLTIQGPGAGLLAISGGNTSRVFQVDGATTKVTLSGLTITQGSYGATTISGLGGGILNNGSTLTVSGCTLSGNVASDSGGGIGNLGTLTVSGCTLSGNLGGGIFSRGTATVTGSTFTGNTANAGVGGGGISNAYGQMTITDSTFSGNSAPAYFLNGHLLIGGVGGAIGNFSFTGYSATMTVKGCTLTGNSATVGGALENTDNATLTVSGCTVSNNSATFYGGGIDAGGALTVANSTFTCNSASEGGAIFSDGTLTVRNSVFTANAATQGAGIWALSAVVDVRGSTFSGNTASDSGGAMYNLGTATIQECTLSGNVAGSAGGGIFNGASGTLAIDDSVVCGNVAPLGADLDNVGLVAIHDSTVCMSVGVS
jgi:predicted outer membrane repeat protein